MLLLGLAYDIYRVRRALAPFASWGSVTEAVTSRHLGPVSYRRAPGYLAPVLIMAENDRLT